MVWEIKPAFAVCAKTRKCRASKESSVMLKVLERMTFYEILYIYIKH
jgi:hypothetical protein